jgi:hypothetical protein
MPAFGFPYRPPDRWRHGKDFDAAMPLFLMGNLIDLSLLSGAA